MAKQFLEKVKPLKKEEPKQLPEQKQKIKEEKVGTILAFDIDQFVSAQDVKKWS